VQDLKMLAPATRMLRMGEQRCLPKAMDVSKYAEAMDAEVA